MKILTAQRRRRLALWGAAVITLVWLSTGFYAVDSNERGVVLRFGKVAAQTGPGLHYSFPRPIDRVHTARTTEVRRIEVGFRHLGELWPGQTDARRSDMLTGDENILKLMMVVQYRIKDPIAYLFSVEKAEWMVERAVESAMSQAISWRTVDDVLTSAKHEIQIEAVQDAQALLDCYDAGVALLGGNLQIVSPPAPVIAAFNDVVAAKKDSERSVENARMYTNQILPRARAEADEIVAQAFGKRDLRVQQARGEAARFGDLLAEYRQNPQVMRKRLYLETLERVLGRATTIVADERTRLNLLDE